MLELTPRVGPVQHLIHLYVGYVCAILRDTR